MGSVDVCDVCGFSESVYNEADAASTAELARLIVDAALEGLTEEQAKQVDYELDLTGDDLARSHAGLHAVAEIGLARERLGHGNVPSTGKVVGLFTSPGGVPKLPIDKAEVRRGGVVGDEHLNRKHHGRPLQALCIWSADVISELQEEGHPIDAGLTGENITVSGIDWASLRPGSQMVIGDVPVLITAHATPCSKIASSFADRDSNRILHGKHRGWSRLYAQPLAEGTIEIGDPITS